MIDYADLAPNAAASAPPSAGSQRARVVGWWKAHRLAVVESLVLLVGLRTVLSLIAALAVALLPEQRGLHEVFHRSGNLWLDVWARWDSEYYLDIAEYGYGLRSELLAFFPLYPVVVSAVAGLLPGHQLLAAVVVSTVASFVAFVYLFKLASLELGPGGAGRALLYLAIYPTALFLFAVYAEALFLALALAAFYHARRGQWVLVGLAAFCAGLTRPNGVVLALPLAYEAVRPWLERQTRPERGSIWRALGALVAAGAAPLGFALWAAYLWWLTGDPLTVVHRVGTPPWERVSSLPWATVAVAFQTLAQVDLPAYARASNTIDLAFAVLLIEASIVVWWRLPRAYAIYLTASTLFLLSSTVNRFPMQSLPRYSLVLFPLFLLLAQFGASRRWHTLIVLVSAPLLGLFTALYATWYWVF